MSKLFSLNEVFQEASNQDDLVYKHLFERHSANERYKNNNKTKNWIYSKELFFAFFICHQISARESK